MKIYILGNVSDWLQMFIYFWEVYGSNDTYNSIYNTYVYNNYKL